MNYKNKIVASTLTLLIGFTAQGQIQSGKASFYSKRMTGQRTANGERLHHDSLTCAHRTYPFGTLLKVTNPDNGKSVIVKVTDRGPYIRGRIIDLSVRAAREIGIIAQGIAPVIVERYNSFEIPFKPVDIIELPELELGANDGPLERPIWQVLRDQMQKKRQEEEAEKKAKEQEKLRLKQESIRLKHEAARLRQEALEQEHEAQHQQSHTTHHSANESFEEINKQPNRSKAYLKRNNSHHK